MADTAFPLPITADENPSDDMPAVAAPLHVEQAVGCGILVLDARGGIIRTNRTFCDLVGRDEAEVVSRSLHSDFCSQEYRAHVGEWLRACYEGVSPSRGIEVQLLDKQGDHVWVEVLATTLTDSGRTPTSVVATVIDLRLRKQFEHRLERANRALFMLSGCAMAVARAVDETRLLHDVCRIAVEAGGYALAWVGLVEHDEGKTVRAVARWGYDEGYVDLSRVTWSQDERGQGPTGTAIRQCEPYVARAIADDSRFAPWRREALQRGFASSIALPLLHEGQPLAALNLYAAEPDAFDDVEISLLCDVGGNLAQGIAALRARQARDAARDALTEALASLEATVRERTEELRQTNDALQAQLTEKALIETALRRRLAAERLVTGMSSRFIGSSPQEVEAEVVHSLGDLGRFVVSDVSALGILSPDNASVERAYWWHADRDGSNRCEVSTEGFQWAFSKVRSERKLRAFSQESVPGPLREFCASRGWHSFLGIPLFRARELVGLLALGCAEADRVWEPDDFSVLQLAGELFTGVLERARADRELAQHRARLEDSQRDLQQFSRRLLAIREEEKHSLSSVLHHEVGSMAVGLTSRFHSADEAIRRGNSIDAARAIEEGRAMLEDVVSRLKRLASDLRPPDLDILGITAALKILASQMSDRARIPITCSVEADDSVIGPHGSIIVFRIVQETLNNIALHSGARKARIRLWAEDGGVVARIKDDGRGFDTQSIASGHSGCMGIRAMREMVASVGGVFEVRSNAGKGTEVRVRLPAGGTVQ